MAARKNRPILYELVRRMRRPGDSGWRRSTPTAGSESAGKTVVPAGGQVSDSRAAGRRRSVRIVHGRIFVELGWPALTVAAIAAVVVLAVAFQAGVRHARSAQPNKGTWPTDVPAGESGTADSGTVAIGPGGDSRTGADRPVVTPPLAQRGAEAPPAARAEQPAGPVAFEFKKDYHYIVIQHFRRSHEPTAIDAAKFVRERGVDCVIERGADVRLIATEAFLLDQQDARARAAERSRCEALNAKIREIGKEFARHQRAARKPEYAFDQSYPQLRTR